MVDADVRAAPRDSREVSGGAVPDQEPGGHVLPAARLREGVLDDPGGAVSVRAGGRRMVHQERGGGGGQEAGVPPRGAHRAHFALRLVFRHGWVCREGGVWGVRLDRPRCRPGGVLHRNVKHLHGALPRSRLRPRPQRHVGVPRGRPSRLLAAPGVDDAQHHRREGHSPGVCRLVLRRPAVPSGAPPLPPDPPPQPPPGARSGGEVLQG
mmetsp:Transcript_31813/g.75600  ORF Transcript_31813/g.75600 Transcript_31813/m.75600 type:complete len:209 (+) Transcript_31813:824-1450(+)